MYKKLIAATGLSLLIGTAASAATVSAVSVTATLNDGSTEICSTQEFDQDRGNICNSLGDADGDFGGGATGGFTSSGRFVSLEYTFGTEFTGPVTFFEITGGSPSGHQETLDLVFTAVAADGTNVIGSVTNVDSTRVDGTSSRHEVVFDGLDGQAYQSIFVTDNSRTPDGFDIDAIYVAAVPLPAGVLLLLSGMGALGIARRFRAA